MQYAVRKMSCSEANEFVHWVYSEPFTIYNVPDSTTDELVKTIIEDNGKEYFAVLDENNDLRGFFEYNIYNGCLELSFGLAPNFVFQKEGASFIEKCLEFGRNHYHYDGDVVSRVPNSNLVAISLLERSGFIKYNEESFELNKNKVLMWCMKKSI